MHLDIDLSAVNKRCQIIPAKITIHIFPSHKVQDSNLLSVTGHPSNVTVILLSSMVTGREPSSGSFLEGTTWNLDVSHPCMVAPRNTGGWRANLQPGGGRVPGWTLLLWIREVEWRPAMTENTRVPRLPSIQALCPPSGWLRRKQNLLFCGLWEERVDSLPSSADPQTGFGHMVQPWLLSCLICQMELFTLHHRSGFLFEWVSLVRCMYPHSSRFLLILLRIFTAEVSVVIHCVGLLHREEVSPWMHRLS